MDREIKFRGKRKDNDEWVYGDLINLNNGYAIRVQIGLNFIPKVTVPSDTFFEVDSATVGQYCELKDSNNREIYEGDIVKYDNGDKGAVYFRFGGFTAYNPKWSTEDEKYLSIDINSGNFEIEVSDNVHEKPY